MPDQILNLTLPMVLEEIENVLGEHPEFPYRAAFTIPELREKLIDYVLRKVPNYYKVDCLKASAQHRPPFRLLEQRLQLENLIRRGIVDLIRENADR